MTDKEFYKCEQNAIKAFFKFHKVRVTHITQSVWDTETLNSVPGDEISTQTLTKEDDYHEWGGATIRFQTEHNPDPKMLTLLRELISRVQYCCWPGEYYPEGQFNCIGDPDDEDQSFTHTYIESTCYHRCSIMWDQFKSKTYFRIEVGFCSCS